MVISASSLAASTKTDAFVKEFEIQPYREGSLSGLRFAVKDLIDIGGHVTGCGNPDWAASHQPAAVNAVCVDQLLGAGAFFVGKTITDELACDLTGENHFYGTPLNPSAPERIPGGSSSGSASAVARGNVHFALGTDTAGSARVPASNCGVWGYRPSPGLVSVSGVAAFASSFDTVGVIARTGDIVTRVASVLLSQEIPERPKIAKMWLLEEVFALVDADVARAAQAAIGTVCKLLGVSTQPVSLRSIVDTQGAGLDDWINAFRTLRGAEVWSNLGTWITATSPEFGPRIANNFAIARDVDRATICDAALMREHLYRELNDFLDQDHLVCFPTVPSPAPLKNSIGTDRYKSKYVLDMIAMNSIAGNARLCQITMPLCEVDGVPVGLSILARERNDALVLSASRALGQHL